MYALTLGDMTWDKYWYSNSYALPQYVSTVDRLLGDLPVYHTMGNHDNDFMTTSDYDAAVKYVDVIAPTYYSFNIGKVHFVVMDDIDCSTYDGTDSRIYVKRITNEQLNWLAKDLAHVDKSTPLIVSMHAQVFKPSGTGFVYDHDSANTETLLDLLDGYEVHFVTGHTHKIFNVRPGDVVVRGRNIHEHNSGSVCASWWWSGHLTPGVHLSPTARRAATPCGTSGAPASTGSTNRPAGPRSISSAATTSITSRSRWPTCRSCPPTLPPPC